MLADLHLLARPHYRRRRPFLPLYDPRAWLPMTAKHSVLANNRHYVNFFQKISVDWRRGAAILRADGP
jgi:hypothetical protein